MKKGYIVLIAVIVFVVIIIALIAGTYNGFVSNREIVAQKQSDVETLLQRRSDLIPNLVSSVKGYVKHEEGVFTDIADARAKLAGAGTAEEMINADAELSSALSRLLVIVENYPTLKADSQFIQLNDELAGTENRIAIGRKDYNEAVQTYNKKIQTFPGVFFASIFGFEKMPYFKAAEGSDVAPTVSFE